MLKWTLAIIFLIISIVVAGVILTITGVIAPQEHLVNFGKSIPWLAPYIETYYIGLDTVEWSVQEEDKIQQAWTEIYKKEIELEGHQQKLKDLEARLVRQEKALMEQKDKSQSIANLATLYGKMRPEEAAPILQLLDKELVLQIILAMDVDMAATILSLLPSNLAAELSSQFY